MSDTLLLAISFPDENPDEHSDPEISADCVVDMIVEEWKRNRGRELAEDERPMVSAIPAPQWLTPEVLDDLRFAATVSREDIFMVLTVYDEHVLPENRGPWRDRLMAAVSGVSHNPEEHNE